MAFQKKTSRAYRAALLIAALTMTLAGFTQSLTTYSFASTLTGGRISQNTTWTVTNSPYIITSDIVVDVGTSLTIEAGVAIRFDGNYSMIINGNLNAVGTINSPIVFTSNKTQPNAGDWNTIKFTGAHDESLTIKNSVIEYGTNGITVQSLGKAAVEDSQIMTNSVSGIHIVGKSNLILKENIIEHNGIGISSIGETVSGITLIKNTIRFNENATDIQAWGSNGGIICNVTISQNVVSFNKNGIRFYIWAGFSFPDISLIFDVLISENEVSHNEGYGIFLYSGGPWFGSIYNVAIIGNRVVANMIGTYLRAIIHHQSAEYDVAIAENTVSENLDKGFHIYGGQAREVEQGIKTSMTRNSITHNTYGILYEGDTDNIAYGNNIYSNTYGMNVSNGATANAENNYWGDINGPFHRSLNPSGKGNPVNGNGVDLDFVPFLSSLNLPPVAVLETDRPLAAVNEAVTFNASKSSDDRQIGAYFFDFGDGVDSGWVTIAAASHAYVSTGMYTASLRVVDDSGFQNNNTATLTITVQPSLAVTLSFNTETVHSGDDLVVHVHVTDGLNPVPEANTLLQSSSEGAFSQQTGRTDFTGDFSSNFTVPSVSQQTLITIEAVVSKQGYWSGLGQRQVTVYPKVATVGFDLILIAVAVVAAIALIIALVAKRKRFKWRSLGEARN